jgi:zinc/manganese transport system permease protein
VSLLVLGVAAAATSQITGALLVFGLLVLPAATAQRMTARPALGAALSVAIALVTTWAGLSLAYYTPWPIGFTVTTIAFALYVGSAVAC